MDMEPSQEAEVRSQKKDKALYHHKDSEQVCEMRRFSSFKGALGWGYGRFVLTETKEDEKENNCMITTQDTS